MKIIRSSGLRWVVVLASATAVALFLSTCVLPGGSNPSTSGAAATQAITVTGASMTLAWDPSASQVASYDVYYRSHGAAGWNLLGEVTAAPQPQYSILHSTVGNGEFDFAVVAIDAAGDRSSYHTSLDQTAQPTSGWYVIWGN